jgi:hypothetical protein
VVLLTNHLTNHQPASHMCVHAVLLLAAETMEGALDRNDFMEVF